MSTEKTSLDTVKAVLNSDTFIDNVCLSYRHDFGLMTEQDKQRLRIVCKEWIRAISNNLENFPGNEHKNKHTEKNTKATFFKEPLYIKYDDTVVELLSPFNYTSIKLSKDGNVAEITRGEHDDERIQTNWFNYYIENKIEVVRREDFLKKEQRVKELLSSRS